MYENAMTICTRSNSMQVCQYNRCSIAPLQHYFFIDLCLSGDINTFMFPSSGAEANEAALRMARLMTGRSKIFARHV